MSKKQAIVIAALVAFALGTGCSGPERPGPNVQDVPTGFMYDANASSGRKVFMDVKPLDESGWFAMRGDDHSSIMITTYAGSFGENDAIAARNAHAQRWGRKAPDKPGTDYSWVEEWEIDGRSAWAWEERQYRLSGDLASIQWTAVVPYEDETYTVEFHAGIEDHMDQAIIRETMESFRAK